MANWIYNGWRPYGCAEMLTIEHYADEGSESPLEDVAMQDCAEIIQLTPYTAVLVIEGNRRNDAVCLYKADLKSPAGLNWPGYECPDIVRRDMERGKYSPAETDAGDVSNEMTLEIEAREQAEEMAHRKTPDRIKPETYSTDVIKDLMDDGTKNLPPATSGGGG